MELDKNTRYIYKVIYGQKDTNTNYDVIKTVHYLRWDNEKKSIGEYFWDRESFAKGLLSNEYKAMAGYRYNSNNFGDYGFNNLVEVIAYTQSDGEIWLKTKADDTKKNNLELLQYAKHNNFAEKE